MMRHAVIVAAAAGMLVGVAGCGDSGSGTTTAPSSGSAARVQQDLRAAGENIKDAAHEAATEVRPALERAKENGRQALHSAAERVAEQTETRP